MEDCFVDSDEMPGMYVANIEKMAKVEGMFRLQGAVTPPCRLFEQLDELVDQLEECLESTLEGIYESRPTDTRSIGNEAKLYLKAPDRRYYVYLRKLSVGDGFNKQELEKMEDIG